MAGESIAQAVRGWIGLILTVVVIMATFIGSAFSLRADIRIVQASLFNVQTSVGAMSGSLDTLTAAVHDRWTGANQKEWEALHYLPLQERVRQLELARR